MELSELEDLAGVNTTLHFFQPFVPKAFEVRATAELTGGQTTTHSITRWWNHPSSHQRSQTVLTDATELTPQEEQTARSRLRRLAERLTADGTLCCPEWREVFQRTWRHPYVPRFCTERAAGRSSARRMGPIGASGYSDESLITKMVPTPTRKAGWFTSSSTMPSPMLTMLEALDVANGCRVLEIGTGSGYDRIIATCSVAVILPVWLEQVVPGLNALRETQLELRETQLEQGRELVGLRRDLTAQGQELIGLRQEMREGFATLSTGMAELTTLLTKITEAEQGN
jgi:hypothetical protein